MPRRSNTHKKEQKNLAIPMEQVESADGFFAPFLSMQQEVNKIIKESVHMAADLWPGPFDKLMPKVKVWEDEKAFYLKTKLPENNPDNIEVVINDNFMTLKWHEERQAKTDGSYSYSAQDCHRTVIIPPNADAEKAQAILKNGELQVMVEKKEEAGEGGRQIPIQKM